MVADRRVFNILDGKKEADKVLFKDDDKETGFVILPDLKWDETSMNALVRDILHARNRDGAVLTSVSDRHRSDKDNQDSPRFVEEAHFSTETDPGRSEIDRSEKVWCGRGQAPDVYTLSTQLLCVEVQKRGELMTDHFHVHVAHIYHEGGAGMMVGQAHLLDDVISLVGVVRRCDTHQRPQLISAGTVGPRWRVVVGKDDSDVPAGRGA